MSSQKISALGGIHAEFRTWVEEQGVKINGVVPARLPGKGTGMTASKKLKKGELLIFVPKSALITLDSEFVAAQNLPDGCTVHGTIAAALTRLSDDSKRYYKPWEAVWPTKDDFEDSTPLCWNKELQDLLPPATKALLKTQIDKLEKDWRDLREYMPTHSFEQYKYYWLLVNTRCFYWEFFKRAQDAIKKRKRLVRDDCMALCPFADYFNHAEEGCKFTYALEGCSVHCNRGYDIGEEVVVSYGAHSNDYLLVEYGFVLSKNRHDNTKLDHLLSRTLTKSQANTLEVSGYLGNYTLDVSEVCYRTQVAIRAMFTPPKQMEIFLAGEILGEKEQVRIDKCVERMLVTFRNEIENALDRLGKLENQEGQVDVVKRRWQQILEMVQGSAYLAA